MVGLFSGYKMSAITCVNGTSKGSNPRLFHCFSSPYGYDTDVQYDGSMMIVLCPAQEGGTHYKIQYSVQNTR